MEPERKRRGRIGEELASRFLELQGCSILYRNLRWADVEVDLVARHGSCLLLVEVKLRQCSWTGASAAVRPRQGRRLVRAARALLSRHAWAQTLRIDVVAIDWHPQDGGLHLQHLRGAIAE
jgi:putative endonuclease